MISVLTPTRGRPDLALRMFESAKDTADYPDALDMLFYLDADEKEDYSEIADEAVIIPSNPNITTVGKAWNLLAAVSPLEDFLMMGNDDLVFRTNGWDTLLEERTKETYPDDIYVAWFDDGSEAAKRRCAFPIVSRKWYETLGYFAPECFNFLWHDTWVWHIGRELGRELYIPEVLVEHCHFSFKKAEYDETYRRHRISKEAREKRAADVLMFADTACVRLVAADRLRKVMLDG